MVMVKGFPEICLNVGKAHNYHKMSMKDGKY